MKKIPCLLLALTMLFMSGCENINPEVDNADQSLSTSYTDSSEDGTNIPDYINADALAHRSYELYFLFAQDRFNSPDEISVNALVQYSFCHLYYDNLTDMPRSGNILRQASADEIKQELFKHFGEIDVDITRADLYNKGRQCFEMWEPTYGTDIYYDVKISRAGEKTYKASSTFYSDSTLKDEIGKTVLTVEDSAGQVLIKKLISSR